MLEYTISEIAAITGENAETIRRKLRESKLEFEGKGKKSGRKGILLSHSEVIEFLNGKQYDFSRIDINKKVDDLGNTTKYISEKELDEYKQLIDIIQKEIEIKQKDLEKKIKELEQFKYQLSVVKNMRMTKAVEGSRNVKANSGGFSKKVVTGAAGIVQLASLNNMISKKSKKDRLRNF